MILHSSLWVLGQGIHSHSSGGRWLSKGMVADSELIGKLCGQVLICRLAEQRGTRTCSFKSSNLRSHLDKLSPRILRRDQGRRVSSHRGAHFRLDLWAGNELFRICSHRKAREFEEHSATIFGASGSWEVRWVRRTRMWNADALGFDCYKPGNLWHGNFISLFTNCRTV